MDEKEKQINTEDKTEELNLLQAPTEDVTLDSKVEEKKVDDEDKTEDLNLLTSPTEGVALDSKVDEKEVKEENKEEDNAPKKEKIFQKFKIKDIVFMAIMTACMLLTGGIMPLVIHVPVFGIIHMALGIQCSLFPTIAMLKVRKPGTLFLMSVFFGLPLLGMQPIMCAGSVICGLITEILVLIIFRGYKKDAASITAGALFFPISLPLMYLYYKVMYSGETEMGEAVQAYVGAEPGVAVGISIAVIAICCLGAILGAVIFKELRKAGVIKK